MDRCHGSGVPCEHDSMYRFVQSSFCNALPVFALLLGRFNIY